MVQVQWMGRLPGYGIEKRRQAEQAGTIIIIVSLNKIEYICISQVAELEDAKLMGG